MNEEILKKCYEILPKEIKPNEVEYLNAKNIGQNIMLEKCRKALPAIIDLVKRELREEWGHRNTKVSSRCYN